MNGGESVVRNFRITSETLWIKGGNHLVEVHEMVDIENEGGGSYRGSPRYDRNLKSISFGIPKATDHIEESFGMVKL